MKYIQTKATSYIAIFTKVLSHVAMRRLRVAECYSDDSRSLT